MKTGTCKVEKGSKKRAVTRLTDIERASLSRSTKWYIGEGSLLGWFYLKVPNQKENQDLLTRLGKIKEPMAWYYDIRGQGRDAIQWCFKKSEQLPLWNSVCRAPIEYGPR